VHEFDAAAILAYNHYVNRLLRQGVRSGALGFDLAVMNLSDLFSGMGQDGDRAPRD
jgi:hypothetical protein